MATSIFPVAYPPTPAFGFRPYVPPKARETQQRDRAPTSIGAPRLSSVEGSPAVDGGEHASEAAMGDPKGCESQGNSLESAPVSSPVGLAPFNEGLPIHMGTTAGEEAASPGDDGFIHIDKFPDVESLLPGKSSIYPRPGKGIGSEQDVSLSQQKPPENESHRNAEHLRSSDDREGTFLRSNPSPSGSSQDHPITLDGDYEPEIDEGRDENVDEDAEGADVTALHLGPAKGSLCEDAQAPDSDARSEETRGHDGRGYIRQRVAGPRTPLRRILAPESDRTMIPPAGRQEGWGYRVTDDHPATSWPRRGSLSSTSSDSDSALRAEESGSEGSGVAARERRGPGPVSGGWRAPGSVRLTAAKSQIVDFEDRDRDGNARRSRLRKDRDDGNNTTDNAGHPGHELIKRKRFKRKRSSSHGRDPVRRQRHMPVSPRPRHDHSRLRRRSRTVEVDGRRDPSPLRGHKMKSRPSEVWQVDANNARVGANALPTDFTAVGITTVKDGLDIFTISTPTHCLSDVDLKCWPEKLIATRLGRQGVAEVLLYQQSSPGFIVVTGRWHSGASAAGGAYSTPYGPVHRPRRVAPTGSDDGLAMSDYEMSPELDVDGSDQESSTGCSRRSRTTERKAWSELERDCMLAYIKEGRSKEDICEMFPLRRRTAVIAQYYNLRKQ
ncbi:hypothetical protein L228DRAFT_238564 [Xylona heveae TC161]|uniref:Myb-like domain-containing protein n=1 Tax=Xylona heveae (strain CBS 132557 / TC161) TaxID=1328760 RepID=A0A165GV96_XYLHT|nr:hypothetical protein L228DRAFT_238564 [Xylona heveae TC161]KZF22638.1 hypothetical protein L228DRAFT_238564 [Xylona heveae TC161]